MGLSEEKKVDVFFNRRFDTIGECDGQRPDNGQCRANTWRRTLKTGQRLYGNGKETELATGAVLEKPLQQGDDELERCFE